MRQLLRHASSSSPIHAYRELLKAQRALFAGDPSGRHAARLETRQNFESNRGATPEEAPALVQDAIETAGFLRQNVVQTVMNERGNYGASSTATTCPAHL